MKKVLAIAPYPYLPYFSGGQKFIAHFFHWLGKEIDLTVISVDGNDFSQASTYRGLPLLKRSFSRYYDLGLVEKVSSLVKTQGFDTIICEHPYFAWLVYRVRRRTGVRVILHTHNIEYQRFRSTGRWWWPILKSYEKNSFKKADALFFISPEDRDFAIKEWQIEKQKCIDLPFGIEISKYPEDKDQCREMVATKHAISPGEKIVLFSGLLNYKPNLDALKVILDKINPLLLARDGFRYKIIICGKGLPAELEELEAYRDKHIVYAGFISDIDVYTKAADIFLNPVLSGGGVKTKMVEAIAFGTTVISTEIGAMGIVKNTCGNKLVTVQDHDWEGFTKLIVDHAGKSSRTPQEYYDYYYWGNIIPRIKNC